MKHTKIEGIIDEAIQRVLTKMNLTESESIMQLQNDFYRTTKQSIDNYVKELQNSPSYSKDKIMYDEIILKIYRLYTSFDSKLRQLIKPFEKTRLNAIGSAEDTTPEESPEKGPNI